jgi:hypothetical protein
MPQCSAIHIFDLTFATIFMNIPRLREIGIMLPCLLGRIVAIGPKLVWNFVSHNMACLAEETNPDTLRLLRKGVYATLMSKAFGLAFSLFNK